MKKSYWKWYEKIARKVPFILFNIDSELKFEYDMQISEELLYEMMWNMINFYQLISNLCFDQEKELRIRLFCECPKKHISDNWSSKA